MLIFPFKYAGNLIPMAYPTSNLSDIDLRSMLAGVVRRWWVVVICVAIGVGVVFAQDSGLRPEPSGNLIVERKYEALVETSPLSIVRVDPGAIVPVPSFDNQLAILQSKEILVELQAAAKSDAVVEVTRSEPRFTITDTIDEENNYVSFLSTGTPSYTFRCVGSAQANCEQLIEAYVAKTIELRKASVLGGLKRGMDLTSSLIETAQERLADSTLDQTERAAQLAELSSLRAKFDALEHVVSQTTGSLILITDRQWMTGKSIRSVTASTYGFGLGVGLVLGILFALQLAALDKKIRHAWQIRRVDEDLVVIGSPFPRHDESQVVAVSAALRHAALSGFREAIIVAEHPELADFARQVMNHVPEISTTVIAITESATVGELAKSASQVAVVLIKVGHTTRRELAESIGLVTAGGARLLGATLVS